MYSIHEARRALAGVDLVEGLPLDEMHVRLEIGLRLGDTGQGILAFYLAELAELGRGQVTGHRDAVLYAEGRLGMDRRRAGELIAAGLKLRALPRVHRAFCEAEIGWSKVLELIKVVVPEHEEAWLERAKALNCKELRRQVQLSKVGATPREPGDVRGTREPRFPVRATLDALQYEVLENAKRKLSDERGAPITDAEFLELTAKLILGSAEDGSVPGRKRLDHSLYQIVIHDGGGESDPGALLLDTAELGLVPLDASDGADDATALPSARSAAIRCDAESTCDGDHRHPDPTTPSWMRKRVLHRDGHRCRICGATRDLEVHHIAFREHGGPTKMWNLISTCNGCHSLVHARLIVIEGKTQKKARFVDAGGKPLSRAGEYTSRAALLRLAAPRRSADGTRAALPAAPTTLASVPAAVDTTWWQRHADLIRCRDGKRLELSAGRPRAEASDAPEAIEPVPAAEAFGRLVGQDEVVGELAAAARGSRVRGEAHPHTLFVGPAGTGKTTLAGGTAKVAGRRLVRANGPLVQDVASLLGLLTQLAEGDMLFLDEVHAAPRSVLEVLYEAMTDRAISLTLHDGLEAKPVRLHLPRFTVLAATTAEAALDDAFLSRFGTRIALGLYAASDLAELVMAEAAREGFPFEPETARLVAEHARGTPRGALRLLERVLNDVIGRGGGILDEEGVQAALGRLGYDAAGLDRDERRYLDVLGNRSGPVALAQLARALRVDERTIVERVEPELLGRGLVSITPRGRVAVHERGAGYPAPRRGRAGYPAGRRRAGPAARAAS